MKTLLTVASCLLVFTQLLVAQEKIATKDLLIQPAATEEPDSLSYEITIIDPGFDLWLHSVAKPISYYSQKYLENWNRQYVAEWNYRYTGGRDMDVIECMIDYDPNTDYGFEVNYQLYEYFQYVESEHHLQLLPRAGR
jgi:hypothetical protein